MPALGIEYASSSRTTETHSNVHSSALSTPPPRILVADDDEDFLELVTWLLKSDGFLVGGATNGADLLAFVADGSPSNLVITDVQMPGISGMAVLSYIKKFHSSVPVILMTAFAPAHLREAARANGAAAVLAKPFSSVELSELVARHIRVDSE